MEYEVIVVGAGIGGLTTAAILAARGMNVCLFERQSRVGGCITNFEKFGYSFEPTFGLYSGWEPGGVFENIFSQLPATSPPVHRLELPYVVRLPDRTDVHVCEEKEEFANNIRLAFPECAAAAILFLNDLHRLTAKSASEELLSGSLENTSLRFRTFVDVQLQTFAQCSSDQCTLRRAAEILTLPTRGLSTIVGGAEALAHTLATSFTLSGGHLRLDSTVLRLAYGSDDKPSGVDLLTGERAIATRGIVSNLTIWDTYGKLVGPRHTPESVVSQLKKTHAWGTYLMFLTIDESTRLRLPSDHLLIVTDWNKEIYSPENQQLSFNVTPALNAGAPNDKRTLTVAAFTQADDWFTFHENHNAHEEQDQAAMEHHWHRLHSALPELGDNAEVIETATPRTMYDATRRKFGMTGSPSPLCGDAQQTIFSNLYLVGDTASNGIGIEGAARSGLAVADLLTRDR